MTIQPAETGDREEADERESPRDAAAALATAALFDALSPLDRAKLAATLEDRWVPAGEVVFEEGGRGDALYILRSGTAERRVAGSAIGTVAPPEIFGELALLTGEPRSASIVALTPLRLWVLPRARFHPLIQAEPELLLRLSAAISQRLAEARTALGALQRELDGWVADRLAALPRQERELVERGAVLDRLEPALLAEITDSRADLVESTLAGIADHSPLVVRDGRGYCTPSAIRGALLRRLDTPDGHRRLGTWRRRAGRALERRGDLHGALASYLAAGADGEARRVFDVAPRAVRRSLGRDGDLPVDWRERLAVSEEEQASEGAGSHPGAAVRATLPRLPWRRLLGTLAAVLPVALLWWAPPPGLGLDGWRALLILVAGAVLLAFDVLPDALVVLLMVAGWVVPGLVEPRVALSGFGSPSWLLVLSVLALGAAIGSTGLLYRVALIALARAPTAFAWRGLVLALVGTIVTPTLPNATSRVALAAPLIRELAEALGYQPGGRAAAGLGLAGLVGFGQMSGLFLTGSSVGLLVYGLLPPEVRAEFSFGRWFLAALPVHLVLFALALLAIVIWYRPEADPPGGAERLALQRAVLGPTTRAEWLSLAVLVSLVVGFLTEPLHGVDGAWLGIAALVALVVGGVLDATMLRTGVNWNFLLFFGVITSLGSVFGALGLDRWLAGALAGPVSALAASSALFCLGLTLAGFALSLVVRWQAAAPLLTLVAMPAAAAIGINPFLVGVISLVATGVWFFPFQSTVYLALYHGSGELFSNAQARRLAWAWAPMVLVSVALAVPMWRWMGLLR